MKLRDEIDKHLSTDPDLDAFCIDHFPNIYQRFSSGMERTQKVNLLLQLAEKDDLERLLGNKHLLAKQQRSGSRRGSTAWARVLFGVVLIASIVSLWFGLSLRTSSSLKLVSVSKVERKPFPILDVKLLNEGSTAALIDKLELIVISSTPNIREFHSSPPLESSHVYHLLINPLAPKPVARDVSFEVHGNSADRFHVVIGAVDHGLLFGESALKVEMTETLKRRIERVLQVNPGQTFVIESVSIKCKLRIHYNGDKSLESSDINLFIYIDPHFVPGHEEPLRSPSVSLGSSNQARDVDSETERIEISGFLPGAAEPDELLKNLRHPYVPLAVASGVALSRLGQPQGQAYLRELAMNKEAPFWNRVLAIRGLILSGYLEPAVYLSALHDEQIRLEAIRVLAFLREPAAVPELIRLLHARDDVVHRSLELYSVGDPATAPLGKSVKSRSDLMPLRFVRLERESEEIVQALGCIEDGAAAEVIQELLQSDATYEEISHELLTASIDALANMGAADAILRIQNARSSLLALSGLNAPVEQSLNHAVSGLKMRTPTTCAYVGINRNSSSDLEKLIYKREEDDLPIMIFSDKRWCHKTHQCLELASTMKWHFMDFHTHNPSKPFSKYRVDNIKDARPPDRTFYLRDAEIKRRVAEQTKMAMQLLPAVKARFLKGLRPGETLYVSIYLTDQTGHTESAFLRVVRWKDQVIDGLLSTDLKLLIGYKPNQVITIHERDIYDWTITDSSGSEEGNFVGKLLEEMAPS